MQHPNVSKGSSVREERSLGENICKVMCVFVRVRVAVSRLQRDTDIQLTASQLSHSGLSGLTERHEV